MAKSITYKGFIIIAEKNSDETYCCGGVTNPHGHKVSYGNSEKFPSLSALQSAYERQIDLGKYDLPR